MCSKQKNKHQFLRGLDAVTRGLFNVNRRKYVKKMTMRGFAAVLLVSLVVITLLADARKTPEYVKDLRKIFNDEYSGAYYRTLESTDDLESTSKSVFRYFVQSHGNSFSTNNPDSYLAEWKKVYSNNGPFDSRAKLDELLNKLHHPDDFQTELQMEMLLDNRDNAEPAKEAFKKAFVRPDNVKVEQFYLGDDDIMHGVMVAAVNKENIAVFLVLLMD